MVVALAALPSVLAACGGADRTEVATVARVEGTPISRASLLHWMRVKNAHRYGRHAPFPDPPSYDRCVATAKALGHRTHRQVLPAPKLRSRCARAYAELKDETLAFLITARWAEEEAEAHGIRAPRQGVESTYERLLNGPGGSTFATNLRRAGMSKRDALFELRLQQFAQAVHVRLSASQGAIRPERLAAYRRRWRQRTICRAGYVIHDCRNYRTSDRNQSTKTPRD